METTRQQRVSRLLQKDLAEIMRINSRKFGSGIMISVTVVRVSPDLGMARVYLSIFPGNKTADVLSAIQEQARTLRYELGTLVGKQLRVVPELQFFLDDSLDYAERIDDLLK